MASQANPSEKPTMLTYIEQTPAQLKLSVEHSEELTAELVDLYARKALPFHLDRGLRFKLERIAVRSLFHDEVPAARGEDRLAGYLHLR